MKRRPRRIQHDEPAKVIGAHDDCAVQQAHFTIPLKRQDKPTILPPNVVHAVKEEYAIKYLQKIGASSTAENIAMVLENLPLEDCRIATAWRSRGSLSDVITIDLYPHARPNVRKHVGASSSSSAAHTNKETKRDCTTTPASSRGDRETSLGGLKAYQIGPVCMSFDDMKRQYLLPFKHGLKDEVDILSTYGMKHEEPAPFVNIPALSEASAEAVVHLLGRRATPRRVKCMEERIIPPEVKVDVLLQMQKAFYSSLPLAALSLRDERDRLFLYEALLDTKTIQLVQTVARYLYLQMFIKLACTGAEGLIAKHAESHLCRPPPEEIEGLYVSTTRIFAKIKQQLEREEKGIPLFLPLVLLALRVSIETIYRIQYPVSFNVTGPTMQYILMQMDASITKMLDPDEHLSRIGVLETTCESTKIMASHPFQIKKRQGRLRDQFYKTSDALHSIFPRPLPGKCRKIIKLRGGASIASYPPHLLEPQEVDDDSGRLGDVSGNNSASAGSQTATEKHNSGDTNVSVYARLQLLRIIERKGRRSI